MKKITSILLLLCTLQLQAQQFEPFKKDFRYQYINQTGDTITSFKIVSTAAMNNDSVSYFNPISRIDDGLPQLPDSNNAFGKGLVKKSNGDFIFFTTAKDSFLLKTQVLPGSQWVFYKAKNIEAICTSIQDSTFLGKKDLIMHILLSDGSQIKLSKSYGLITSINLNYYLNKAIKNPLLLSAIPELGMGDFFNDPAKFYNFEIGDVFYYSSYIETPMWPVYQKLRKEVLERTNYGKDSIVYKIKIKMVERNADANFSSGGNEIFEDIISYTVNLTPVTNYEFVADKNSTQYYEASTFDDFEFSTGSYKSLSLLSGEFLYNKSFTPQQITSSIYEDTTDRMVLEACSYYYWLSYRNTKKYAHGLGMVEFEAHGAGKLRAPRVEGYYHFSQSMTCYSKKNVSIGNCSIYESVLATSPSIAKEENLLYPNPAEAELFYQLKSNLGKDNTITIFNSSGILVKTFKPGAQSKNIRIECADLPAGKYTVGIEGDHQSTKSFIKY